MSSISSPAASQLSAIQRPSHPHSGRGRLSSAISDDVANGTISAADGTALTSALGSIDSSLSSDATSAASGRSGSGGTGTSDARLDPSQIKDRIDGLIADQVSGGSLTSDQGSELKNLFASHGRTTQGSNVTGAGGPPPGPPPGQPPADATGGGTSSSTTDLLASFIQQLQASQASSYAASGTSSATSNASALLFDFQT